MQRTSLGPDGGRRRPQCLARLERLYVDFFRRSRREQPAGDAAALVGVWHLAKRSSDDQDTDLEILPDGRMIYAIREANKWQLMKLTYRLEGNVIVSNQPSAPREERTEYSFQSDGSLILSLGGEQTTFRRGERRVPFHEH